MIINYDACHIIKAFAKLNLNPFQLTAFDDFCLRAPLNVCSTLDPRLEGKDAQIIGEATTKFKGVAMQTAAGDKRKNSKTRGRPDSENLLKAARSLCTS